MDPYDHVRIMRHLKTLSENISVEEILPHLMSDLILTYEDREIIQHEITKREKAMKCIQIVLSRGPKAYASFRKALSEDYEYLGILLDKTRVSEEDVMKANLGYGAINGRQHGLGPGLSPSNSNPSLISPNTSAVDLDMLVYLEQELKSWYSSENRKMAPVPWEDGFQVELNNVYTDLQMVRALNRNVRIRTEHPEEKSLVGPKELFGPVDGRTTPRRVLIEGDPGIGKSTFCNKLLYDWSTLQDGESALSRFSLVLALHARDLSPKSSVLDHLYEQLLPEDSDLNQTEFKNVVSRNQKNIVIVVDGYDEFMDQHSDFNKLLSGKILSHVAIIVTSRPGFALNMLKYFDSTFVIVGYGVKQRLAFIDKFAAEISEPRNRRQYDAFKVRLTADHVLSQLCRNPLHLCILCMLLGDTNTTELPQTKTALYQEMEEFIIKRASEASAMTHEELKVKCNPLAQIAYHGLLQSRQQVTEEEILKHCDVASLQKLGFFKRTMTFSKLKHVAHYTFTHKSFQEYFAAKYVAAPRRTKQERLEMAGELLKTGNNKLVMVFLCGLLQKLHNQMAVIELLEIIKKETYLPFLSTETVSLHDVNENHNAHTLFHCIREVEPLPEKLGPILKDCQIEQICLSYPWCSAECMEGILKFCRVIDAHCIACFTPKSHKNAHNNNMQTSKTIRQKSASYVDSYNSLPDFSYERSSVSRTASSRSEEEVPMTIVETAFGGAVNVNTVVLSDADFDTTDGAGVQKGAIPERVVKKKTPPPTPPRKKRNHEANMAAGSRLHRTDVNSNQKSPPKSDPVSPKPKPTDAKTSEPIASPKPEIDAVMTLITPEPQSIIAEPDLATIPEKRTIHNSELQTFSSKPEVETSSKQVLSPKSVPVLSTKPNLVLAAAKADGGKILKKKRESHKSDTGLIDANDTDHKLAEGLQALTLLKSSSGHQNPRPKSLEGTLDNDDHWGTGKIKRRPSEHRNYKILFQRAMGEMRNNTTATSPMEKISCRKISVTAPGPLVSERPELFEKFMKQLVATRHVENFSMHDITTVAQVRTLFSILGRVGRPRITSLAIRFLSVTDNMEQPLDLDVTYFTWVQSLAIIECPSDEMLFGIINSIPAGNSIRYLSITNCCFNQSALKALCEKLKHMKTLKTFDFRRNNVPPENADHLEVLTALEGHRHLVHFGISNLTSKVASPGAAFIDFHPSDDTHLTLVTPYLCHILSSNYLESIFISNSTLGSGVLKILNEVVRSSKVLLKLVLPYNTILSKGHHVLTELLTTLGRIPPKDPLFPSRLSTVVYLQQINFIGTELSPESNQALADVLRSGIELQELSLGIFNNDNLTAIAQGLRDNRSLKHLEICKIIFNGDAIVELSQAISSHPCLETLILSTNDMVPVKITHLFSAMKTSQSLSTIALRHFALEDIHMIELAQVLRHNEKIVKVNLRSNLIGPGGVDYLYKKLEYRTKLWKLDLSDNKAKDHHDEVKLLKTRVLYLKVNWF